MSTKHCKSYPKQVPRIPPDPQDPDGSYTGRPADGGKPVQDADDL